MGDPRSLSSRAAGQPPSLETLDAHTITLVQTSWARVVPIADAAVTLFYDRLFALDPSLKALFKPDMREQKKKLMQTLGVAVDGLRHPARLLPVLEDLGVRHAGYMVQDRHYDLVGQALLWTLGEGLGDEFTPEIEAAWRRVYGVLAGVMRRAASQGAHDTGEDTMQSEPELMPPVGNAATIRAASIEAAWPTVDTLPAPRSGRDTRPPPVRTPDARTPDARTPDARPDARTIELVQASWARVLPISDAAATLFYDRLFALDPSLKALFKPDMREQKKKLMQTLSVAVDGLRTPDRLVPVLQNLGARHTAYMVQDHHYDLVGQALLWTLREGLGDAFTPAIDAAWQRTYGFIAGVMKQAAAPRGATAAEEKLTVHYPMPGAAPAPQAAPAASPASPPSSSPSSSLAAPAAARVQPPAPAAPAPLPVSAPAAPVPAQTAFPAAVQASGQAAGQTPGAPASLVLPVTRQEGPLDVRLTFANIPAPLGPQPAQAGTSATASAVLLAVTCGTLVVLIATAVLFGLYTLGGTAIMPAEVSYAVPLALMGMAVAVFFLGYWWGRRSARRT